MVGSLERVSSSWLWHHFCVCLRWVRKLDRRDGFKGLIYVQCRGVL